MSACPWRSPPPRGGFRVIGFDIDRPKVEGLESRRQYPWPISRAAPIAEAVAAGGVRGHGRIRAPRRGRRHPDLRADAADAPPRAGPLLSSSARRGTIAPRARGPASSSCWNRPPIPAPPTRSCGRSSRRRARSRGATSSSPTRPSARIPATPSFGTADHPEGGRRRRRRRARGWPTALYGARSSTQAVPVSSPATAEAVKLTENIFRAVNIALVNELKVVYDAMGIDVWEVIEAAKTKPFGFMPFYPGPGLGGHCIPIDPFYLTWKAREYDVADALHRAGRRDQHRHAAPRRRSGWPRRSTASAARGLRGARILILGLAYKKNVDDMRESPALKLIELLEARGAEVGLPRSACRRDPADPPAWRPRGPASRAARPRPPGRLRRGAHRHRP